MTAALALTGRAQIVLNVPPDPAPPLLTNAEVLNLLPGGRLGNDFLVGEDAVLNVQGGVVGNDLRALPFATINLESGIIGSGLQADSGSAVTISGGRVGDEAIVHSDLTMTGGSIGLLLRVTGGTTTISGGRIDRGFDAGPDAVVRMSGGIVDDLSTNSLHNFEMRGGAVGKFSSQNATFHGTDFRLDSRSIAGLDNIGDEATFTMPERALFTGLLADGTPFVFDVSHSEDDITGHVRLVREDPPPAQEVINIPGDPVPFGIRDGQTLNLHRGGVLPHNFTAGEGSTLNLLGGTIGENFEVYGATVNIHGGTIGGRIDSGEAFGDTVINMTGGMIDGGFQVYSSVTFNFTGGVIGDNFDFRGGSTFNMTGGRLEHSFGAHGAQWNLRGGRIGGTLSVSGASEPTLTIHGFEFQVDRQPVEGLSEPGDEVIIAALEGTRSIFTGRLADGTPFAFRDDAGQSLHNPVRLILTEPPTGPTIFNVPSDPAPFGVGDGQTLNLRNGGVLADSFIAGPGSVVNIEGGRVGDFMQAVDAEVNIRGGRIGGALDAFAGAVVTISGGTFGPTIDAYPDSTIVIEGTSFSLDGVPFADLDEPGESLILTTRGQQNLRAVLADGSVFELMLDSRPDVLAFGRDYVDPNATLRLVVAAAIIPEPSTFVLCGLMGAVIAIGSRWILAAPRQVYGSGR